ncbi:uncharacterized protein V6R79_022486 [Siganus canaliculatus]
MNIHKAKLLLCWMFLCMDTCLSQKDCTGVDCPLLQNCIESHLEIGACCPTCRQRGCTCEGYQYYDCVQAGFRKGKVPEAESYFVDFGSTECSCPRGGGNISCHFIPCPALSPHCIDIVQPADGCPQCGRIGCAHGNKKYEAGHTFQMDRCQVCHCPNEGGNLMCSPIHDCDLHSPSNPESATNTENNKPFRDINSGHENRQTSSIGTGPFSKLALGNTLPLYKPDPPSFGTEDYDYTQGGPASSTFQDLARPLESTTVPLTYPESRSTSFSSRDDRRYELRETQKSPSPERSRETELTHDTDPTTTGAQSEASTQLTTTHRATAENQQEVGERGVRHNSDRNRAVQATLRDTTYTTRGNKGARHSGHHKHSQGSHAGTNGGSHSAGRKEQEKAPVQHKQPHHKMDQVLHPTIHFSPTSSAPVRIREDREQPQRQPQTLYNYQPQRVEEDVSAKELVKTCCETGKKWASTNGHCNEMEPPTKDRHSICWNAQHQCCLGSLEESQCLAGINTAKAGATCQENASDKCGGDSFKDCCQCCSLGLQFRSEGHRCEAHQDLGFNCRHIFLTCCEEEEESRAENPENDQHSVREKPTLTPTTPPKKVSDSLYPNEAFSIGEEQDGENAVEGPDEVQDVDECQISEGNICHHQCVNTPGSFRCECFPGYVLQEDAVTCAQETVDAENVVKEDDRAAVETTTPTSPPTEPTVAIDHCEGNGPCEQQCTSVGGRAQCSCLPGFSLMADGRSCEDVNECLSPRACELNERCMNTAGSYVCQRLITCPPGHQINNDVCEDINECVQQTHNCGFGFECVNTEGSFRCTPKPRCGVGFSQDTHGSCVDVDECGTLNQPCSPGFNCINTMGSYMCQRKILCSRGYHASPDGSRCIDVDECQSQQPCGEGQLCHNLPGSFRCECQTGYQYDSFRRMCVGMLNILCVTVSKF